MKRIISGLCVIWLTNDDDNEVKWFLNKPTADGSTWDSLYGDSGSLGYIKVSEFEGKDWTECCVELESDYSEWVGKLCEFQNSSDSNKYIGILDRYSDRNTHPFLMLGSGWFAHCRPIKPDEVEFVK